MEDSCSPVPTAFTLSQSLGASRYMSSDCFSSRSLAGGISLETSGSNTSTNDTRDGITLKRTPAVEIESLPNEILADLFELAYFNAGGDDSLRKKLLQISHRFRSILLETPSIWSVYTLSQSNINKYLPVLPVFLERSKAYPLDISINCFWPPETTYEVLHLFLPHSARWRRLAITTPNTEVFSLLNNTPVPILESVALSHFSSERRLALPHTVFDNAVAKLSSLTLRNVSLERINMPLRYLTRLDIRGSGRWPQYPELCEMLGDSDNLQELALHVKPSQILKDVGRQGEPPILLPALRTFRVDTSEGLTTFIADLIRMFSCPNLQTLRVQEGPGLGSMKHDIMCYSASPSPTLSVTAGNMNVAWRCLSLEQSEKLKVFNAHNAGLPAYSQLELMLRSMVSLDSLVFTELNTNIVIEDLEASSAEHGQIPIPSLRTLDISVTRRFWSAQNKDISRFIRLFHIPALFSLLLCNISASEWGNILTTFGERPKQYRSLTALTLANIHDFTVGQCSDDQTSSVPPVEAFPHLRHLSLVDVQANPILRHIVSRSRTRGVAWPELKAISLRGNTQTSKPLLHHILEDRVALGRPLSKLFLDESFRMNTSSWEWIKDHVDVVEI